MNPPDPPPWKDITGSSADQARQQSRRRVREEGKRRGIAILAGAILLPAGVILLLAGIGLHMPSLMFLGVLSAAAGIALLQATAVRVFRFRDRGHGYLSVEESVAFVNPLEEALDKERQRRSDQGFEAFVKGEEKLDAEANHSIKVRCLSCQTLNEEQANFCAGCGTRLR